MAIHALIVAGGAGSRMGNAVPKQFLPLAGKPLMYYALQNFVSAFGNNVRFTVVLHPQYFSYFNDVVKCFEHGLEVNIVAGGVTRYDSVKNGVLSLQANMQDVVMVHDAARPLAHAQFLIALYKAALAQGSAVPVMPIAESMRQIMPETSVIVPRDEYVVVQTPQCFTLGTLAKAFGQPYQPSFTDEASVVEAAQVAIALVPGIAQNIKVTTPQDMQYAEFLLTLSK